MNGIASTWAEGISALIWTASSSGVRTSVAPLTTSVGTSGSGPAGANGGVATGQPTHSLIIVVVSAVVLSNGLNVASPSERA